MAAPTFRVVNMDQAGTTISTITPVGGSLRWTYRMAQAGGPGDIAWEVALSDSNLGTDDFAPYRTDWKLVMNGTTALCAGIMAPVNTGSEASGEFSTVKCTGLDWLHYLEQPYPFDYAGVVADVTTNQLSDAANLFKIWNGATQSTVVGDLIASLSGYVGAVPFTTSFLGTGWSSTMLKDIGFGDNTTVLDLIVQVAQLASNGASTLGFDMWVKPDKTIVMTSPRVTDPSSVTPVYTLNDSSVVVPPLDWTNNGPLATDTVTFGQGSNNTTRIGESHYAASRTMYRQWVRIAQVDMTGTDEIAAAADSIGQEDRFPHKDLKLTIRPDLLDSGDATAGFTNLLGQAIGVNYNVSPYHHINANFWIVEQAFYSPDGCNWLCDLTLEQIYTSAASPSP